MPAQNEAPIPLADLSQSQLYELPQSLDSSPQESRRISRKPLPTRARKETIVEQNEMTPFLNETPRNESIGSYNEITPSQSPFAPPRAKQNPSHEDYIPPLDEPHASTPYEFHEPPLPGKVIGTVAEEEVRGKKSASNVEPCYIILTSHRTTIQTP